MKTAKEYELEIIRLIEVKLHELLTYSAINGVEPLYDATVNTLVKMKKIKTGVYR